MHVACPIHLQVSSYVLLPHGWQNAAFLRSAPRPRTGGDRICRSGLLGGVAALLFGIGGAACPSHDETSPINAVNAPTRRVLAGTPRSERPLYDPLGWALVRAPLLPIETYRALGDHVSGRGEQGPPAPVKGSPLPRLLRAPRIRTALAVGSVSLFDALERSVTVGDPDCRLAGKLLRYLIRMSSRPTPFGLFAGVALIGWGPETDLSLAAARPITRTRPDMATLLRLAFELESRREVRRHLRYLANPQAFVHAGRVFLPEPAPSANSAGPKPDVSVRATDVVRRALALARTPIPHDRLVAELAMTPGATIEKVEALVDELWRQTFLLTDLRPPLTNPSPAAYVARRLQDVSAAAETLEQLESTLAAMAKWDTLPMKEAAVGYRRLAGSADGDEDSSPEASPQVDMALPLEGCHINEAVAREATRAAELLLRMTPLPGGLPHLNAYRGAFEARYGHEREVPLLELLDPNFGLGLPSTHLHGLDPGVDAQKAALRQQTLYDLAATALWERRLVVDLDTETLSRLESWSPSIATAPSSIDLCLFVVAASAEDVDEGRFQIVVGPNLGAAAGRNLGRFADLLGDEARKALEEVDQAEFAHCPDHVRAELVYLPHRFRSSNIAVRAHPHPYEICLGTTPGVPPEQVIPLDELVVGIREDRFYVRWRARDARVLACAGHMLNNLHAPDVCRFLDDVRRGGLAQLSPFDWGPVAALPVLPRVQVGRVVLSLAQWRIDARTRRELVPDAPSSFMPALREWRGRWQVPRYVYLSSADNRLILDLDNEAQAEELRTEVRKLKEDGQLLLQEPLPAPDQAWVAGPGGHFVTELVVPLVLHTGDAPTSPRAARRPPPLQSRPAIGFGPLAASGSLPSSTARARSRMIS